MRLFIRYFGVTRLLAMVLSTLPLLVLPALGLVWLWQTQYMLFWLLLLVLCSGSAYLLHHWISWREKKALSRSAERSRTGPDPAWPPASEEAWAEVEALAESVTIDEWPLGESERLLQLGRQTLETVALHFHPGRTTPVLELTVPHALLIVEKASRELRKEITDQVPMSHLFTVGSLLRAQRWKKAAGQLETFYRVGRAVFDPSTVLFREFRRSMNNRIMGYGASRVQNWLLREYVRKTGYYAIELYSGRLLLEGSGDPRTPSEAAQPQLSEPMEILVLGRGNAGKSSLINALFGELKAVAGAGADTTSGLSAYQLEQEGESLAIVSDTPGFDSPLWREKRLRKTVLASDLILWVTPAHRPDRAMERELLDRIRGWQEEEPARLAAPILMVLSHIDQLRPLREWSPPYDLSPDETSRSDQSVGQSAKADSIREAVLAVAEDLDFSLQCIIPVCLAEGRQYNVEDALMSAILANQDEADRVRFLRCIRGDRRQENWKLTWRQLGNSGRLLLKAPVRYLRSRV